MWLYLSQDQEHSEIPIKPWCFGITREVAEKLKEIERHLKDGSSHSGAVAVNHSIPRVVEHVPGPTIQLCNLLS
jgi:hypothetical protein